MHELQADIGGIFYVYGVRGSTRMYSARSGWIYFAFYPQNTIMFICHIPVTLWEATVNTARKPLFRSSPISTIHITSKKCVLCSIRSSCASEYWADETPFSIFFGPMFQPPTGTNLRILVRWYAGASAGVTQEQRHAGEISLSTSLLLHILALKRSSREGWLSSIPFPRRRLGEYWLLAKELPCRSSWLHRNSSSRLDYSICLKIFRATNWTIERPAANNKERKIITWERHFWGVVRLRFAHYWVRSRLMSWPVGHDYDSGYHRSWLKSQLYTNFIPTTGHDRIKEAIIHVIRCWTIMTKSHTSWICAIYEYDRLRPNIGKMSHSAIAPHNFFNDIVGFDNQLQELHLWVWRL